MSTCQYCKYDNEDTEMFCCKCGRPLRSTRKQEEGKSSKELPKGRYSRSKLQIPQYDNLENVIISPKTQLFNGTEFELIFEDAHQVTLEDFYYSHELNSEEVVLIEKRILDVFCLINAAGFIVGSCDFSDFIIDGKDFCSIKLQIKRPLLRKKEIAFEYETGEFCAPEVKNKTEDLITVRSDVYIAAAIFNRMVIGDKYIKSDIESQLRWAYLLGINEGQKDFKSFHTWLGLSLSMFPQKRYKNLEESINAFDIALSLFVDKKKSPSSLTYSMKSVAGVGKSRALNEQGREKGEWNEDAISSFYSEEKNIYAFLLADGISNCGVGSGYLASEIVKEVFEAEIEGINREGISGDFRSIAEDIIYRIVRDSNLRIYEKALEETDNPQNIMGSTIVLLLYKDGELFYFSLGDSRLFLIREENMIPLNYSDNVKTRQLLRGIRGNDLQEAPDALVEYIGGRFASNTIKYTKKTENAKIFENDYILIASDGVFDYMGNNLHDSEWDKEQIILKKVLKYPYELERIVELIIKQGNTNGGGDNMSIILIKTGGLENVRD